MPRMSPRPDGTADVSYSTAETAVMIRKALAEAFPGIKFSVRGRHYSNGSSVDVTWTDGPTSNEVREVARQYEDADFDSSTDSRTYKQRLVGRQHIHYGPDNVLCQRTESAELLRECAAIIAKRYNVPAPTVKESSYTHGGKVHYTAYIDRDSGEPLDCYADGRVANYNSKPGDKAMQLAWQTSTYNR
jgi:hypothetical protein